MQFLVTHYDTGKKIFEISGDEARHISLVLRKKPGDIIKLFDGKGITLQGEIQQASAARITGRLLEDPLRPYTPIPPHPHTLSIHLYQALPKGVKWDWVLEKGCEVGVATFIPLLTERMVVRWHIEEEAKKMERWRRVLAAAAKQCGRPQIPEIKPPVPFASALVEAKKALPATEGEVKGLGIFCWESEAAPPLARVFRSLPVSASPRFRVLIFIGPEGGWDIKEADAAKAAGLLPVSLGSTVLRAETAPIVAVSMLRALSDT